MPEHNTQQALESEQNLRQEPNNSTLNFGSVTPIPVAKLVPKSFFSSVPWPEWAAVVIGLMIIASAVGAGAFAYIQNSKSKNDVTNSETANQNTSTKNSQSISTYDECINDTSSKITKNPNQCVSTSGKVFIEPAKIAVGEPNPTSSTTVSKTSVKSAANGNSGTGVNVRVNPCESVTGNLQKWGSVGELLDGPISKECLGGKYTWYKVDWTDGSKGWSISDNLIISNLKDSAIVGSLIYPSEYLPNQRVCAKETTTQTETCIDSTGQKYSISVPAGTYQVYVKGALDSSGKLTPWGTLVYYNKYVKDCMMKGYPGTECQGNGVPNSFHTEIILVKVETGSTVENINPWDWYAS